MPKKPRVRKPNTTKITAMKPARKLVLGKWYVISCRFDSLEHIDDPDENRIPFRSTNIVPVEAGDYMTEGYEHIADIPVGSLVYFVQDYDSRYYRVGYGDTFGLVSKDWTLFYEIEGQ